MSKELRTKEAEAIEVLARAVVGRYVAQAYERDGEFVYRVLSQGRVVCCWTDADQDAFPEAAARAGAELVDRLSRRRQAQEREQARSGVEQQLLALIVARPPGVRRGVFFCELLDELRRDVAIWPDAAQELCRLAREAYRTDGGKSSQTH